MASLNKVLLIGNLTRDPELKTLPSGTTVAEFGLAVNRRYKRADGTPGEDVLFVDISVFGRRGETLQMYVHKGDPLFVAGRMRYERWQTPEGQIRTKLSVICEDWQFLPKNANGAPQAAPAPSPVAVGADDVPF